MIDIAIRHLDLAGRAQPMATGVRQIDAGAKARIEDRLSVLDFDGLPEGLDRELVAQNQYPLPPSPSRPGVVNRIRSLWPMPLSFRLLAGSGLNTASEFCQITALQSIRGKSG